MIEKLILKIKRGETPFFRRLRSLATSFLRSNLPQPSFIKPVLRLVYHLHFGIWYGTRRLLNYFYREPLFRRDAYPSVSA